MFVLKVLGINGLISIFLKKEIYVFQLSYKIRSKGKFPSAEARTNDGTGCRPTDDSINSTIFNLALDGSTSDSIPRCDPTNYYHSGFLGLQAAIDFSWISVSKHLVLLKSTLKAHSLCQ